MDRLKDFPFRHSLQDHTKCLHVNGQAGKERFSVELEDDDMVWYEVLSLSRTAHFFLLPTRPYIHHKQKLFSQQSTQAMLKVVSE